MVKPQYTAAEVETLLEDALREPCVRDVYSDPKNLGYLMASTMSDVTKQTILFNYPQTTWYLNN